MTDRLPPWAQAAFAELAAEGLTPIIVSVEGAARAVLGLGDPIRSDAAATLARLHDAGHRLALLSGDRQGGRRQLGFASSNARVATLGCSRAHAAT